MMLSSRFRRPLYWVTTALLAVAFGAGAVFNLSGAAEVQASLERLGFPAYVAPLLGFWKGLGVLALLVPRFERLKEWTYAGMFFDLTGAAVSHLAAGDAITTAVPPLVLVGFLFASWALRPENRRLPSQRTPAVEAPSRHGAFARP